MPLAAPPSGHCRGYAFRRMKVSHVHRGHPSCLWGGRGGRLLFGGVDNVNHFVNGAGGASVPRGPAGGHGAVGEGRIRLRPPQATARKAFAVAGGHGRLAQHVRGRVWLVFLRTARDAWQASTLGNYTGRHKCIATLRGTPGARP